MENKKIRNMTAADKEEVLAMMRVFYASPAVLSNGSEEIFCSDIAACVSDNPYLEGYVVESDGQILGYSMIAKSFSTEFGKPCIWIEDIYLKPESRGKGIGGEILQYIQAQYPGAVFRLEAEPENEIAVGLYRKMGFEELAYMELKK
jgi:ribosomal protein S18 acetylase RimI-like enzyme